MTKKRKTRKFDPKAKCTVSGATAPSGTPYIHVRWADRSEWLQRSAFRTGGHLAQEALIGRNIVLLGKEWSDLAKKALKVSEFPVRSLVEQPGWGVTNFALPNGIVVAPSGRKSKPVVLFTPIRGRCRARGTIDEWLRDVAEPLSDQLLAMFVLMIMFAPPLLRIVNRSSNFGLELSGPKGVGKSTLQFLAASVVGPALSRWGLNYWRSANATAAGLEGVIAEHADLPLVIEETNLFAAGETERNRAAKFNEFVFRLADGTAKARHKDYGQQRFRFVYLTSTNEPLDEILGGQRSAVSDAAADRLLTLPIGPERPHGVFDFIPEGHSDAAAFARALSHGASLHFGTAMRTFLQGLVDARCTNAVALRRRIESLQSKFRKAVGVDMNSGSATRVADAFGLVYAAGKLAKRYGALPTGWNCLKAARAAYELNRAALTAETYRDRLIGLAERDSAVDLSKGAATPEAIDNACALVTVGRGGRRELLLTPNALDRAFADSRALFRDPAVKRMMISDERRKTVKRRLRPDGKPERIYCFALPRLGAG